MKNLFKSNKKGFTLVELLAVIVILALLIVITANTILPLMSKTERSGMVTYAERVISNATASAQADFLVAGSSTTKYYKVTELMDTTDYYGCIEVSATSNEGKYSYVLKLFSNDSDNYYLHTETATSSGGGVTGTNLTVNGKIEQNGTISGVTLDNMKYSKVQTTGTTPADITEKGNDFEKSYCTDSTTFNGFNVVKAD